MDIKIETSRLTLRPWGEEDIEHLTLGLNDLELAKWLAFVPHPYTTSHAQDWIRRCQEISDASTRPIAYEFAVELQPGKLERFPKGVTRLSDKKRDKPRKRRAMPDSNEAGSALDAGAALILISSGRRRSAAAHPAAP